MDILSALGAAPEPPPRPSEAPTAKQGAPASQSKSAFDREFDNAAATKADDNETPAANEPRSEDHKIQKTQKPLDVKKVQKAQDAQGAQKTQQSAANVAEDAKRLVKDDALGEALKTRIAAIAEAKQTKHGVESASKTIAPVEGVDASVESAEPKPAASATDKKRLAPEPKIARALGANLPIEADILGVAAEDKAILKQAAKQAAIAAKIAPDAVEKDKGAPAAKEPAKSAVKTRKAIAAIDAALLASPGVIPTPQRAIDRAAGPLLEGARLLNAIESSAIVLAGNVGLTAGGGNGVGSGHAEKPLAALSFKAPTGKSDAKDMAPEIAAALRALDPSAPAPNQTTAPAAPQNPAPAPAAAPVAAADPAAQVIAAIHAGHGRNQIEVRLDPPDLGSVRIHFNLDRADAVTATVTSDRGDTLNLLRRHSDDLMRELQRAGFARVELNFSSSGRHEFARQRPSAPEAAAPFITDPIEEARIIQFVRRSDSRLDRLV